MRNIILLQPPGDGEPQAYGSIVAMLEAENPVNVSPRQFSNLQAKGWPVVYAGCTIRRLPLITVSDAKKSLSE